MLLSRNALVFYPVHATVLNALAEDRDSLIARGERVVANFSNSSAWHEPDPLDGDGFDGCGEDKLYSVVLQRAERIVGRRQG